jgi:copper homeostasis protein
VFGILDGNANIDAARMRELIELARPLEVTFHRAFDMTADLFRAFEDLCACGVSRLLTAGGEQTSVLGQAVIARLVERSQGRVIVMPGSGIKPDNARALVEQTGAREIHVGLRSAVPSAMRHRNPRISMGTIPGREYQHFQVLEESVRSLCSALAGTA